MIERLLRFSIHKRILIMFLTFGMAAVGVANYARLPIDAVPDVTNVQVQINTEAPGYTPADVEQQITFPLEVVMGGLPHMQMTRSISRYGLSQLTVIFDDGTDIYFARQLISERIQEAKGNLPAGLTPEMGPITTGLGEIFMWTVEAESGALRADGKPYTATDFRTAQDWIIKPQLRNVKGVTDVNSVGGYERQIHVTANPGRLVAYGLTFRDIVEAIEHNNSNVGAGYIERSGEQYLVRAPGQVKTLDEIRQIVVGSTHGVPIRIHDVAEVGEGEELRTGAATKNAREVVLGTVFMLIGENSRTVSRAVEEKMVEINRTLPKGLVAITASSRTALVDKTIATVQKNLAEGAILVIVILFLFLGNIRAALITALVIPLSMLFTITGMVTGKISANLMSLGALDFGIIVDGAIIIVENCIGRLSQEQHKLGRVLTLRERLEVVFEASTEVRKATMFGEAIIMIVYLPILTLTGVEGKMFIPMALTVVTALFGAMILSVTFVPAAIAIFLSKPISEKPIRIVKVASKVYSPALDWALVNRMQVLFGAAMLVVISFGVASTMGAEFLPTLEEGDIAMHALRIPGTSLTQAISMQYVLEERIKRIPEVDAVVSKIGTSDIATDPMPPSVADNFIFLKPRSEWADPRRPMADLVAEMEAAVKEVPGNNYEFTQPIEMRFNELLAGVRSDVAVKVFGDDMEVLEAVAKEIEKVVAKIPGGADVKAEQTTGLPVLSIEMNHEEMSRHGLNASDVQDAVRTAIGGTEAGKILEGDRRFPIIVRLPGDMREDIKALSDIPIPLPEGAHDPMTGLTTEGASVPLGTVARFELTTGPNSIGRENSKRRVIVTANVRGRDIASFVKEAQQAIAENVEIPSGYWITWGGTFEQLISATNRLKLVVPGALLLIFGLLFINFGNAKDSFIVFTGVPLALTGGIFALFVRGIPLSISAGVGFIALSGVAVLNGLVMVAVFNRLRAQGVELVDAVRRGSLSRLRPILMTALVAALGFVPMALATGTGSEVQRPLATVVIGGILSSTLLTLLVLPVAYAMTHRRGAKHERE